MRGERVWRGSLHRQPGHRDQEGTPRPGHAAEAEIEEGVPHQSWYGPYSTSWTRGVGHG